jgi:general secretion pathway protein M
LRMGVTVVMFSALWFVGLSPAWRTWQEASMRQAHLDEQTKAMWQLKVQAQNLQKINTIIPSEAKQWLEQNLEDLGPGAKISFQDGQCTLSVIAATAEGLARWISQARVNAMTLPLLADFHSYHPSLNNTSDPRLVTDTSTKEISPPALLRGTLVLRLP